MAEQPGRQTLFSVKFYLKLALSKERQRHAPAQPLKSEVEMLKSGAQVRVSMAPRNKIYC